MLKQDTKEYYKTKDTFFYKILEKNNVCNLGNLSSVLCAIRILNLNTNQTNLGILSDFFVVTVI
jgi:hypothetical protein